MKEYNSSCIKFFNKPEWDKTIIEEFLGTHFEKCKKKGIVFLCSQKKGKKYEKI